MKRTNIDLNSLIENIELLNCKNERDEFEELIESSNIKVNSKKLEFKEVYEILRKAYRRYKRYLANIDLTDYQDIEEEMYLFIRKYESEINLNNLFTDCQEITNKMIYIDSLILKELEKCKKPKTSEF